MIRHSWLAVLLAGCAGASARPEGPLDRMISKTNAYTSFLLKAEISDGKTTVPIEMAWKAPDRGVLRYGTVATTFYQGGKLHHYLRGTYSVLDFTREIAALAERYPGLAIGRAPEAVFTLGDGIRAQLWVGRLGARLGWLEELRGYAVEGNVYRHGQTVIELREDGFIGRTDLAGTRLLIKEVTIDAPVADAMFELPPTDKLQDVTARMREDFARGMDEAYHRWMLETSTTDETLETIIRIDLVRKYDPDKLTAVLRESLTKSIEQFRTLHPDARPEVLKDKLIVDRGRAMGSVDIMEEEIQKEFEKSLDKYIRGMTPLPNQSEMQDVVRRWHAAVKRQVDQQIRRRFEAVFDAVHKE